MGLGKPTRNEQLAEYYPRAAGVARIPGFGAAAGSTPPVNAADPWWVYLHADLKASPMDNVSIKNRRYLLFAWCAGGACAGWRDLNSSHDDILSARRGVASLSGLINPSELRWHIVDMRTMEIVEEAVGAG